jgi:hypothetical protein
MNDVPLDQQTITFWSDGSRLKGDHQLRIFSALTAQFTFCGTAPVAERRSSAAADEVTMPMASSRMVHYRSSGDVRL